MQGAQPSRLLPHLSPRPCSPRRGPPPPPPPPTHPPTHPPPTLLRPQAGARAVPRRRRDGAQHSVHRWELGDNIRVCVSVCLCVCVMGGHGVLEARIGGVLAPARARKPTARAPAPHPQTRSTPSAPSATTATAGVRRRSSAPCWSCSTRWGGVRWAAGGTGVRMRPWGSKIDSLSVPSAPLAHLLLPCAPSPPPPLSPPKDGRV